MMQVSLNLYISFSRTKREKLNDFDKIPRKVGVTFIFLSFIRILYPGSTSYSKTAQSFSNSWAEQTKEVYNGRNRAIFQGKLNKKFFHLKVRSKAKVKANRNHSIHMGSCPS